MYYRFSMKLLYELYWRPLHFTLSAHPPIPEDVRHKNLRVYDEKFCCTSQGPEPVHSLPVIILSRVGLVVEKLSVAWGQSRRAEMLVRI